MKTWMLFVALTCAQSQATGEESLTIWPDHISRYVREHVGAAEKSLGYSAQQMANFPGNAHRLGYVSQLFRDAEQVPTETNRLARELLDEGFETAVRTSLRILGARISVADNPPDAVVEIVPVDAASQKIWEALPAEVSGAVERLVRGALAARPHLHEAFDWNSLARQTGDRDVRNLGDPRVYSFAAAPWLGYGYGGSGPFGALNTFRSTPLGNAGALFLAAVRSAVKDLMAAPSDAETTAFDVCRLRTPVGIVAILGRGDNAYRGSDAMVIDLGGNDRYTGRLAVPSSKQSPVGLLIDLAGNDTYDGRGAPASIACGLFGIGVLVDVGGHDKYYCSDSGLGCAWHGIGLLLDTVGDDTYSGHQWCQGAAHAGVGMLIDEAGDDKYYCQLESQGLGGTLGIGVLLDKHGNDRYHAYDNENGRAITFPSSQTKSHEASLAQGCGYGRRADSTDGRSMAGGVGALIDGAGDDSYYGGVFSQATGFWWSLGMLVDFGGNDTYRGVYFAQGASAHFAVGSLVDHGGDDRYNDQRVLGQVLGGARDGSVATFVDLAGDDVYYIPKKSAGGGDMNSIGLFCDRRGDDEYHPLTHDYMGAATIVNARGEYFRNIMATVGVFVDLAGNDRYPASIRPQNGVMWYHESGPHVWGFGFDARPRTSAPSGE